MTIAVDLGRKAIKQTKQNKKLHITWAAGFSHSIVVTKNRLYRNFS